MICEKCCFWPCDRTNTTCGPGIYYKKDPTNNRIIKMIEPPSLLAKVLEEAVISTLESEGKKMDEEERCVLADYSGKLESICYICTHREVCPVPNRSFTVWLDFCTKWNQDKAKIADMINLGLLKPRT